MFSRYVQPPTDREIGIDVDDCGCAHLLSQRRREQDAVDEFTDAAEVIAVALLVRNGAQGVDQATPLRRFGQQRQGGRRFGVVEVAQRDEPGAWVGGQPSGR